jgi:hypothetical protein
MTKKEVEAYFKIANPNYKNMDKGEKRLSWGLFTDFLCKSNEITLKQYESWDYPRFLNL